MPSSAAQRKFLTINPQDDVELVKGLSSPMRLQILHVLRRIGPMNVNQISKHLGLPQSTIATNVQALETAGLIRTELVKAAKGQQKVCSVRFDEIVIRLDGAPTQQQDDLIEVSMPLGLYTGYQVSAPCGLCSPDGIIGLLDVPDHFLDPSRMQASLIWFGRGHVEYKFPNNAKILNAAIEAVEFSMELSSEVPGTNSDWPSDISLWVNDVRIGTWTSPGDFGDHRGIYTPRWWKLEGSQYGKLTTWKISERRQLPGRRQAVRRHPRAARPAEPSLHARQDRHRRRSGAPRRGQHLRPRLRQLRSGHPDADPSARARPAQPYQHS